MVRERYESDESDRGEIRFEYTFNGLDIVDGKSWYDLVVDFDVKVGDTLYMVVAFYDTGDSFGREYNEMMDIAVYKTASMAYTAERHLTINHAVDPVTIFLENGNEMTVGKPWQGYFERLDRFEVIELIVKR